MAWKIFILLCFLVIKCTFAEARQEDVPDENFENFLNTSMAEFPSWLNETHLPYLVTPGEAFPFQFKGNRFNLTGILSNQNVTLSDDYADTLITNASLTNFTFSVKSSLSLIFSAEHETTGSYLNESGLRKEVDITGRLSSYLNNSFELRVNGFQINSEGYIDLSSANIDISQNISFYYFRLEDSEDDIGDAMTCVLNAGRDKMKLFPVSLFAQEYLQKIFTETPIDEMKKFKDEREKLKTIEQDPDAKLSQIIDNAMKNFWNWILESNLDPTPLISDQFKFEMKGPEVNITGEFWNHKTQGHGYSEGVYGNQVSVADRSFRVGFQNKKFAVDGDYFVGVTFSNGSYFEGMVQFWAPSWRAEDSTTIVNVNGFNISEDGYIDLSAATIHFEQIMAFDDFVLEGLYYDAEVREEVWKAVYCAYKNQVEFDKAFPIGNYAVQYLQEIFNENPI